MGTREVVVKILQDMGWSNNFAIPILNEKNKKLMHEYEKAAEEKEDLEIKVEKYRDRVQQMTDHYKNVKHELSEISGIYVASKKEVENENHESKLNQHEIDRMKYEINLFSDQIKKIKEKINSYENAELKNRTKIDEIRQSMKVDNKTLEAWLQEAEAREEDIFTLDKYQKQDASKIKDLRLYLERLNADALSQKKILESRLIETHTNNVKIDKALDELKITKFECKELLNKWESSVKFLKVKDEEIDSMKKKVNSVKNTVREKENGIREITRFLSEQKSNTQEMERKIQEIDSFMSQLKIQVTKNDRSLLDFKSEMESLKRQTDRTSKELENTRSEITFFKREKSKRTEKIDEMQKTRQELIEKLKFLENNSLTSEQLAKESEAQYKAEEESLNSNLCLLKKLRDENFTKTQDVLTAKHDSKTLANNLLSSRNMLRTLNQKLEKIDKNILRQQEILYNQDFSIQQFERKIAHMKGDIKDEIRTMHELKLKSLESEWNQVIKILDGLKIQLEQSENDLRRVKRETIKLKEDEDKVNSQLKTQELETESCEKELAKLTVQKKDKLVDKNILEVELDQLKKLREQKSNSCIEVEKEKAHMDASLRIKMKEVESYENMLKSEHNMISQENSNLKMEIQSRTSRIEKLINRYDIINYTMAGAEGAEEVKSQAYYVIKAAQEKEALQRKGDALDGEIRQLERETHALQNTLDVMKGCNQVFKENHGKLDELSEERQQLNSIQETFRNKFSILRSTKSYYNELNENYNTLKQTQSILGKDLNLFSAQLDGLNKELKIRDVDAEKVKEKVKRAFDLLKKIKSKSLNKTEKDQAEKVLRDIDVSYKLRSLDILLDNMAKELLHRLNSRNRTDLNEIISVQLKNSDYKLNFGQSSCKSSKPRHGDDSRLSTPSTISISCDSCASSSRP